MQRSCKGRLPVCKEKYFVDGSPEMRVYQKNEKGEERKEHFKFRKYLENWWTNRLLDAYKYSRYGRRFNPCTLN
jgi:hypothetical protein